MTETSGGFRSRRRPARAEFHRRARRRRRTLEGQDARAPAQPATRGSAEFEGGAPFSNCRNIRAAARRFSPRWPRRSEPYARWLNEAAAALAVRIARAFRDFRLEKGLMTYRDQIFWCRRLVEDPAVLAPAARSADTASSSTRRRTPTRRCSPSSPRSRGPWTRRPGRGPGETGRAGAGAGAVFVRRRRPAGDLRRARRPGDLPALHRRIQGGPRRPAPGIFRDDALPAARSSTRSTASSPAGACRRRS